MTTHFPFAVRLLGFTESERELFQDYFELEQDHGHAYFCLSEDSLQDPDLFIANGDDLKALAQLSACGPSDARPALLLGRPLAKLPYACLPRPISWELVFSTLARLIEKRADVLSRLPASDLVAIPDRRRRERLDIDLSDPADYLKMRRAPTRGGVLIVDKNGEFANRLGELMARYHVSVDWVDNEDAVIDVLGHRPVAVVMINTSIADIEPYRLCVAVKQMQAMTQTSVIFLVGKPFVYDREKARAAGSDGLLDKPLQSNHVIAALKKFLPMSR